MPGEGTFLMMIGLAITFLVTALGMAFIPAMNDMKAKIPIDEPPKVMQNRSHRFH